MGLKKRMIKQDEENARQKTKERTNGNPNT